MKKNVLVLSADTAINSFLGTELIKAGFDVNLKVRNIFDVPRFLMPNFINVLIIDTDSVLPPQGTLKSITDRGDVFVILLGVKNAASFVLSGIRGTISKPDNSNSFSRKVFLRSVLEKIDVFSRAAMPREIINISQAAHADDKIIVIASSTGGTEALSTLISALPAQVPPIIIVQHMPSGFTHQFALRLNQLAKFSVKEAGIDDIIKKNQALVAPGDLHMKIKQKNKKLMIECIRTEKVHGVRPAADITFNSLAECGGKNTIGVVLTGMGSDGARGLASLKKKGATIIAQNQETSVVYGMPKATVALGIVDFELPLNDIAGKIKELI